MERQVEFHGHVLDKDGLHADPKVSAVQNYPLPKTRSEMRTFLGIWFYYGKFILRFSKTAAPLREMTSEKGPFEWNVGRTTAFEMLTTALISTTVLAQPDIEAARSGSGLFCINTDKGHEGIGAVLSQKGEGNFLLPVFFVRGPNEKQTSVPHHGPRGLGSDNDVAQISHVRLWITGGSLHRPSTIDSSFYENECLK